ncbi:ABC transporter substrate-binding protein [Roseomonas elaeocarpi]|uniref:ABC transporter substrate-binding protein n=1 Tax=Roseomonas elaeocarpi TaxID=907779 RepID=A0ABV6JY99_9PROT
MGFEHLNRRSMIKAAAAAGVAGVMAARAGKAAAQGAKAPVTLVLANSQWLDALRGKSLWNAVLEYQKVAPHVTLEQEAIPSAEFDNRLTTEFGAGQGPDIAIMQEGLFYSIADAGFLVDLAPVAQGVSNLNATNGNGVVKGKRLGIAWQRAVYALIYNKPLLDAGHAAVPTTVEALIASARAVTAATGAIGFTARHQIADFSGWFMDFQNWAYGYGVNWVDGQKITVDTPEALAAFRAFKQMYDAKILPIGDNMPTQRTRFKENKVAFSIDNSGGTLNIVSGGALAAKDLYAAPLPFPKPGAHQQIFLGVNGNGKHKDEAIAFLRWLVSADGQMSLRKASGPDALATDVPVTEEFRAANPWADRFVELAKTSRSTLIPGYEVETTQIMRPVMEALERVIVAGADPKPALAEAQRRVDQQF